jgi:hypothetical protein
MRPSLKPPRKVKMLADAPKAIRTLLLPLAVYLAWTAATYVFEGRIHQMLHYDPVKRATYVVIANVIVGTIVAAWALRRALREWVGVEEEEEGKRERAGAVTSREEMGFRSLRRTLPAVLVASIAGLGIFLIQIQRAAVSDPILILNAFALVLPVSIAEVIVCWARLGSSFERLIRPWGRAAAALVGILASDVFFAVYHFAHSPPFNQPSAVLFLLLPGLVTGIAYFAGRDVYATIVIQNFLGMMGVTRGIDVQLYSQPLLPLYILAILAVGALVASDILVIGRRGATLSYRDR